MFLIFDTETTGLPKDYKAPISDINNWPRCVQIAWQLHDAHGKLVEHQDFLIQPKGFNVPYDATQVHGISTELATSKGELLEAVLDKFNEALQKTKYVVGHNIDFDLNIMGCEFYRTQIETNLLDLPKIDTCNETTANVTQIRRGRGGKFKLPNLSELHQHLFEVPFQEAHNATADVEATTRCFFELIRLDIYDETEIQEESEFFTKFREVNSDVFQPIGLKHVNLKKESEKLKSSEQKNPEKSKKTAGISAALHKARFAHLHVHSQFSILQATSSISELIKAALNFDMPALAITDSGNMMNAFNFVQQGYKAHKEIEEFNQKIDQAKNYQALLESGEEIPLELMDIDLEFAEKSYKTPFKPIVGCEFNVCQNHENKSTKDNGYQVVMLAKNKNGYLNLAKMSTLSHTHGFYYVPRIDKKIIEKYKDDIIVLSGHINGEIPNKILNTGEAQAEEALLWWKTQFGDDFYLEINRHGQENEDHVNEVLLKFIEKHQVKVIATNNTFYTKQAEAEAHDILLCVNNGEKITTPIGKGRGFRFGLPNNEYYFKSQEQMKELFADQPAAIENIQEIIDKVEVFQLKREVLLPKFGIPKEFINPEDALDGGVRGENAYLKHLANEGAEKRWGKPLEKSIQHRLDFELSIIEKTGYPGYFLIVWDLIAEARKMDVSVGPGRGSAAGSVVAYALGITNIDPIKYNLLFERFLNPDRVSLPDIDIDFDDEGRQKVIEYVIEKYGSDQVAQIITYGSMAAKSSIRDTARVLDLPLSDADRIAKLVPDTKLQYIFGEDAKSKSKIEGLKADDFEKVKKIRQIFEGNDLEAQTVQQAHKLEGAIRNTGIHACGVIITPEPIANLVPIATAKDAKMCVTQFDNGVVESAGLLKMDFLGLKTLTLIKDTVKIVKNRLDIDLVPDEFPLDDEKTYELFQRGETIGIFQYESPGMQKHLKALKPTQFEDLIAMNALYRPGPMEYIPSFINRKHGAEEITYDLEGMEEFLKETYGITVYQEQVMSLSQKLANFTKGEADMLRKGMGKKIAAVLEKLKPKFIEGGKANNHKESILEKVWKDWEAFASYAFNKSHATCYAYIAYQTAYLKANYPAEYMAAVLSNNMRDIKQVTFFMKECQRAGIPVLGPDVNESHFKFAVNQAGAIRFGMGAIKGVGEGAVENIVKVRKEKGDFQSIFDVVKRVDLRTVNKRVLEGLVFSGALDSFKNTHRAQYFEPDAKGVTFIERVLKYGNTFQDHANSPQMSLFGKNSAMQFPEPVIPVAEPWGIMETLSKEKEVVGIFLSGHPLDDYKTEIKHFCHLNTKLLQDIRNIEEREGAIGGMITHVDHKVSKNGKGWAIFTIDDYEGSYEFKIFSEEYLRFKHMLVANSLVFLKIRGRKNSYNDEVKLAFISIELLQEVLEKYAKKITLQLPVEKIDEAYLTKIEELTKNHKGSKPVSFKVVFEKEKLSLHMPSRSAKVIINTALVSSLEKERLDYRLN